MLLPNFLRDRLQKSRPLVVGKPVEPRPQVDTHAASAQVIALRPVVEPTLELPVQSDKPEIITNLSDIPLDASVLTANVGKPVFPVARHLETALMLLEVAPRRVQLYYDPESQTPDLQDAIKELRQRLLVAHYDIDGADRPCAADIIAALLENYKKRAQQFGDSLPDSASRKLWESWVDTAWRTRASDLHIEFLNSQATVRIRVDGELVALPNHSQGRHTVSQADSAVSWAYGDYTQDSSNNTSHWSAVTRIHAYAMFKPRLIDNATVNMRFQSMTGAFGPKVVLRLANQSARTLTFAEQGFERSQQALFRNAQKLSSGLVLFTGVTGSGKTTAIKTYLETHPVNGSGAINTLEEPVEQPIKGTHQTSAQRDLTNPEKGKQLYREMVASELRMDPDGIMIGEIRDDVTASAIQQILDTGHFAVSSLHSHFLSGIAARLAQKDVGYSRELFTAPKAVNLLVYQALVPIICPHCRINALREDEFSEIHFGAKESGDIALDISEVRQSLEILDRKFKLEIPKLYFRRAAGCSHCAYKGTVGRTVVAEMMQPDRKWLELTRTGDDQGAIDHYRSASNRDFYSDDMTGKTIFEHTLYKSLNGWVDVRQCELFDTFNKFEVLAK